MNISHNGNNERTEPAAATCKPGGYAFAVGAAAVCLAALLSMLGGCWRSADLEMAGKFQAAQKAFDEAKTSEDYAKVAALYQEMLDRGCVSGAVLFNQGNSWVKAGQPGRAIAAYRRAMRYEPRDPHLNQNLSAVRGFDTPETRRPILETIVFWQNWLSYPEKIYLTFAAALATFAMAVAGLFNGRKIMRRTTWAGVIVTGVLTLSAAYDWNRFDNTLHGVVVVPETIAHKSYSADSKPAFNDELSEGTEFRVIGRRGDWLNIQLPGVGEGWIEDKAAAVY